MIIGAVYKQKDGDNMSAVPLFINDKFRICGFSDLDHNEMMWVLSWASGNSTPYDDVLRVMAVSGDFFHMFRNKCHPNRSWSTYAEVVVFNEHASAAIDVQLGVQAQLSEQAEFWRLVVGEVESLPPGVHREIATDFIRWGRPEYEGQGIPLHALATQWNVSREAIKEIIVQQTGKYPE